MLLTDQVCIFIHPKVIFQSYFDKMTNLLFSLTFDVPLSGILSNILHLSIFRCCCKIMDHFYMYAVHLHGICFCSTHDRIIINFFYQNLYSLMIILGRGHILHAMLLTMACSSLLEYRLYFARKSFAQV